MDYGFSWSHLYIRQGTGKRKRRLNYKILNLLETHTTMIYEKQDLYLI